MIDKPLSNDKLTDFQLLTNRHRTTEQPIIKSQPTALERPTDTSQCLVLGSLNVPRSESGDITLALLPKGFALLVVLPLLLQKIIRHSRLAATSMLELAVNNAQRYGLHSAAAASHKLCAGHSHIVFYLHHRV